MSTDLKVYTEQTMVKLFDWPVIITTANIDKLMEVCNSWQKFIKIWWQMVNVNQIASADTKKIWEVESYILQLPRDIQMKIRERDKQKFERVGRHLESVQEIENYIRENNLI